MTEQDIVERLLLFFCRPRERELVKDIRSNAQEWRVRGNEIYRTKPYPAGYCDDLKYVSWAVGWGCGYYASHAARILFRRKLLEKQNAISSQ